MRGGSNLIVIEVIFVPGNFVEGYEIQWRRVMGGTYGYLNG
jgi:hypothetical protein